MKWYYANYGKFETFINYFSAWSLQWYTDM